MRADLWVGSYTADGGGAARGIGSLATDEDGALRRQGVAAETPSPSFLALHPRLPVVYAVGEFAATLSAFRVQGDGLLSPLGASQPAAAAACHVSVDSDGRFAIVTCYGTGDVFAYLLHRDGMIGERIASVPATDPYGGDDRVSRAHASLQLTDGRILTTDLGFDLVRVWRWSAGSDAGQRLVLEQEVALPAGSGPRHLALGPGGHVYVVTEYSIEVIVLSSDARGAFSVVSLAPVFREGRHDGDAAAHISVTEADRKVHVTVRGSDRVAVLDVSDGGKRVEPRESFPAGVAWPRHHLQRGNLLHVAGQRSSTIATFTIDDDGAPLGPVQRLNVDSPTCIIEAAGRDVSR